MRQTPWDFDTDTLFRKQKVSFNFLKRFLITHKAERNHITCIPDDSKKKTNQILVSHTICILEELSGLKYFLKHTFLEVEKGREEEGC